MTILVIAEHDNASIKAATLDKVAAAAVIVASSDGIRIVVRRCIEAPVALHRSSADNWRL
jgi:hypothetical protein